MRGESVGDLDPLKKKKKNTRLSLLLNLKFGIDQGVNYHIDRPGVKVRGGDSERTMRKRGGGGGAGLA